MDPRRHGWLVGGVAALALGAFAPAASAATANITDDGTQQVLHVDAAAGEVNNLWIEGGPQWQVAELKPADGVTPPVAMTGDANCHAVRDPPGDPPGANAVSCDTPDAGGIDRVEVNLGDMDDVVQIIAADVPIVINGGDGNDTFYDTDRTNVVLPVPRIFNGGPGDDLFVAGVDSGQPNDYHGDAGTDFMRYTWRSDAPVKRGQTITLDDVADDGENNEGDNVHSDIEYAFGSDQADTIKGTANADYLVGMGGADAIDGNGGDDRLFADDSTDTGQKICDADVVNGGEGADEITLGGNTTANGGAGDDVIRSFPLACPAPASDKATGGEGQDTATFFDLPAPAAVVKGLKVSLDGVANDGVGGRDNFASDIEDLYANSGGMTLIGSDQREPPHRRGGRRRARRPRRRGRARRRSRQRHGGLLVAHGAAQPDPRRRRQRRRHPSEDDLIRDDVENVRGGSGDDTIVGDAQKNVLTGGGGVDTIDAGDGDDEIDSNDDKADTDTCGAGADKVVRDDLDIVAADCETVGGPPTDPPYAVSALGSAQLVRRPVRPAPRDRQGRPTRRSRSTGRHRPPRSRWRPGCTSATC